MKTHIVFVLDRSGSMTSMQEEAVSGYNSFLEEQQKIKTPATLTRVLFDNVYLSTKSDLQKAEPLVLGTTYLPRGTTALLDAVGQAITSLSKKKRVIFAILTDGHENASHEYTRDQVKKLIEEKQETGWEFHFLAADEKGFDDARSMGISINTISDYDKDDSKSIKVAYAGTVASTLSYRASK